MDKATLIPIQPKWNKMIKDGLKKFEFRNYAIPKGTTVYLYESLGKKVRKWRTEAVTYGMYGEEHWKTSQSINTKEVFYKNEFDNREDDLPELRGYDRREINVEHFDTLYDTKEDALKHIEEMKQYKAVCPMRIKDSIMVHEGQGKVVAEFVVGEVKYLQKDYTLDTVNFFTTHFNEIFKVKPYAKPQKTLEEQGYTNQKYAMEITDLIVYDGEWQNYIMEDSEFDDKYYADYWTKLEDAPTEPLDISEFVGWNKLYRDTEGCIGYKSFSFEENKFTQSEIDSYNLTHAPQGKVYVVEKQ